MSFWKLQRQAQLNIHIHMVFLFFYVHFLFPFDIHPGIYRSRYEWENVRVPEGGRDEDCPHSGFKETVGHLRNSLARL